MTARSSGWSRSRCSSRPWSVSSMRTPTLAVCSTKRGTSSTSRCELRELARGIHPAVLTEHGLGVALEGLVERATIPVELVVELDSRPPEAVEACGLLPRCREPHERRQACRGHIGAGGGCARGRLARRRGRRRRHRRSEPGQRLGLEGASPIGSRRWADGWRCRARPAPARGSQPTFRADESRGRLSRQPARVERAGSASGCVEVAYTSAKPCRQLG